MMESKKRNPNPFEAIIEEIQEEIRNQGEIYENLSLENNATRKFTLGVIEGLKDAIRIIRPV